MRKLKEDKLPYDEASEMTTKNHIFYHSNFHKFKFNTFIDIINKNLSILHEMKNNLTRAIIYTWDIRYLHVKA